jgi:hypothetical protein
MRKFREEVVNDCRIFDYTVESVNWLVKDAGLTTVETQAERPQRPARRRTPLAAIGSGTPA